MGQVVVQYISSSQSQYHAIPSGVRETPTGVDRVPEGKFGASSSRSRAKTKIGPFGSIETKFTFCAIEDETLCRRETTPPFAVGDKVWLKLQSYRQHSVERWRYQKLGKKWYEPFMIIKKISDVAFQLQLLEGTINFPVFHAALHKPFKGTKTTTR